jgi:elongation factor Ts
MSAITANMVSELRARTGAGIMDCKKALAETGGNLDQAVEVLRKSGIAKAARKAGRTTAEGLVHAYIHPGGKIGVLIEVNCETDFVARTDEFRQLVRNLAMQVAATRPLAVRREDVPAAMIERERGIYAEQLKNEGKPEAMIPRIVEGKLDKFYQGVALLEQPYIRDDKKTVEEIVKEAIAKIGENIRVRRFAIFTLGQD